MDFIENIELSIENVSKLSLISFENEDFNNQNNKEKEWDFSNDRRNKNFDFEVWDQILD